MIDNPISRRSFIKGLGASAATFSILPSRILGQTIAPSPNNRINIAIIGVGGMGAVAVNELADQNIVAFCDVDDRRVADAMEAGDRSIRPSVEKNKGAKWFKDFRKMFDQMGDQIDAVAISTPDHMHYAIAMWAIGLGKHVYVQKPLTRTIGEARRLTQAAREKGVITQMGNQGHSTDATRVIKEWIDAGVIGEVREVHWWTDRPIWPQGMADRPNPPAGNGAIPQELDWDLWLGSAPERPYDPAYVPFNWRGWWDFGCGALGDMGCHIMDAAYYALNLGHPTMVDPILTANSREAAPNASVITYHFPARGNMPPVKGIWYDGGLRPALPPGIPLDLEVPTNGSFIIGEKATVFVDGWSNSVRIVPEARMLELRSTFPKRTLPRVKGGPFAEWCKAIQGGPACGSAFDYSGPFTEVVNLGNVAIRAGRRIEWDPSTMTIPNAPEANLFVDKDYEYRKGWGI